VMDAVRHLEESRDRYARVAEVFQMPWQVVAAIHSLEASGRFDRHLHNGDPLSARTRRVPAGRPLHGSPPFTWEESAQDALAMKKPGEAGPWTVPRTLWFLERYNGLGYRKHHPSVKSPYLWSFTNWYRCGKYVADGRWSSAAISSQVGCVPILKGLGFMGEEHHG